MHLVVVLVVGPAMQAAPEAPATAGPQLLVDVTADAALACAAGEALANALRKRLPGVRVGTQGVAGAHDLTASLRREQGAADSLRGVRGGTGGIGAAQAGGRAADGPLAQVEHWVLALSRADGEAVLVRALAHDPSQCVGLAEAAALVIDRFLADVNWPGLSAGIDPGALAEPPPPAPVPPLPPPPPFWQGATVAAGPSVRAIRGESVDIGAYVQTGLLMPHGARAEIEALAYSSHRNFVIIDDPVTGPRKLGSLVTTSATAWAGLSLCRGKAVTGCAQVRAGVTFLDVSPRGRDLHAKDERGAWRATLGAGAAVGYALPWELEVVTTLNGMLVLNPVVMRVEGLSEPAYTAPGFTWLMSMGLKRKFF